MGIEEYDIITDAPEGATGDATDSPNPIVTVAPARKRGGSGQSGVLMSNGWIHLHRKIEANPLWLSEPFTKAQAWVDLLLLANYKDRNSFQIRGNWVNLKSGDVGWSKDHLAQRWKWSRNKVLRFISMLEKLGQVKQQKSPLLTVISIVNWETYQKTEQQTKQQTEQQKDNRRSIIKKDKKDKKENKDKNTEAAEAAAGDIPVLIDSFKEINPSYRKWFANTTQRGACERLISIHGKDKILNIITTLKKTNGVKFFPTITTPLQLEDRYADLEAAWRRAAAEKLSKPKVIFS